MQDYRVQQIEAFFKERFNMLFSAKGICYNIGFAWMVMHFNIIILNQLQPSLLSHVQLKPGKDILEALMVSINMT